MEVVGVGEVGAAHDDVLHDGCGGQIEVDLGACMVVGRVEEGLEPRKSYESAVRYG